MSQFYEYLVVSLILYVVSYGYYIVISRGLGKRATFLQMRRYIPCALASVIPCALAGVDISSPLFIIPIVIWGLWIFTYPTIYWYSNHAVSSDFGFHFEAVFGMYIITWISGIGILAIAFPVMKWPAVIFLTVVETLLVALPVAQWIYFVMYKSCINENGMQMVQETDKNEVIEFIGSMPIALTIFSVLIVGFSLYGFGSMNLSALSAAYELNVISLAVIAALVLFLTVYLWKKGKKHHHGVFERTGIVDLYLNVKDFLNRNKQYKTNLQERLKTLSVEAEGQAFDKPSTVILVIGESASRDYMKAFNDEYKYDTTPWLSANAGSHNFVLYPNAYASRANTIFAVSNAMTEMNQYNGKEFYESCSVIDVAHKLGYNVQWYSNQGYMSDTDTAVSLIAETADVAKWTKHQLNTVQFDESLLDFVKQTDPTKNNFIILHLMGSHFNFMNRYPQEFTKFGTPGKYELEENYANSIAYTDSVLQRVYEYAKDKLNLQVMIYFSDHGTKPDKRRSPNFDGMGSVRIPFFTYFSDEYIAKHKGVYDTLVENHEKYWTNDLFYEMMCSIFDVESNRFDEANSLGSKSYRYKKEDLLTDAGKRHIK